MALKPNFYGQVRNAMKQSLVAKGFAVTRPRGCYWRAINEETIATVGLNESKWRGEVRLEIIPSVGVANRKLISLVEDLRGPSQIPLPSQIGIPLGYLMPDPGHRVWKFTPDVDVRPIADDIAENVVRHGIPWVCKHDDLERLHAVMETGGLAYNAIEYYVPCALLLLGREDEAKGYVSRELDKRTCHMQTVESPYSNTVLWFEQYRDFAKRVHEKARASDR